MAYKGKQTCKILKDIRKQIAEENDIELVIKECTYQGDCLGTCPRCEAEVAYLEKELARRQAMGKAVTIAGLAVGSLAMAACSPWLTSGEAPTQGMDPFEPLDSTSTCEAPSFDADQTATFE